MKGHIRERSPGHWAIVIDVRDPVTGKRKRRWHSFAGTKRAAQVECARLIAAQQDGARVDPSRISVAKFLDRFERDWVALQVSAHSAKRYQGALNHVRRHLGERPLQKLRPADIAALYATLSRSALAPGTTRLVHAVLHRALAQAKLWGIVPGQRRRCRQAAEGAAAGNRNAAARPSSRIARASSGKAALHAGEPRLGHGYAAQ
jgi:hypothetical protein